MPARHPELGQWQLGTQQLGGAVVPGAMTAPTLRGNLPFTGSTPKQTRRNLTGALSFAGKIAKRSLRLLTGTLLIGANTATRYADSNIPYAICTGPDGNLWTAAPGMHRGSHRLVLSRRTPDQRRCN